MDGKYKSGFELYRARLECVTLQTTVRFRRPDLAMIPVIDNLRQATGKHVLVSHEGGFGDDIQFVRYLTMLADVAGRVTVQMPRELHRIFSGIDPRVRIVASHDAAGNYDLECPVQQFPCLFGTELDTIPADIPYLTVPDAAIGQRRLPELSAGAAMRVGLVWAGSASAGLATGYWAGNGRSAEVDDL